MSKFENANKEKQLEQLIALNEKELIITLNKAIHENIKHEYKQCKFVDGKRIFTRKFFRIYEVNRRLHDDLVNELYLECYERLTGLKEGGIKENLFYTLGLCIDAVSGRMWTNESKHGATEHDDDTVKALFEMQKGSFPSPENETVYWDLVERACHDDIDRQIVEYLKDEQTFTFIADKLGMSVKAISKRVNGYTNRHGNHVTGIKERIEY